MAGRPQRTPLNDVRQQPCVEVQMIAELFTHAVEPLRTPSSSRELGQLQEAV